MANTSTLTLPKAIQPSFESRSVNESWSRSSVSRISDENGEIGCYGLVWHQMIPLCYCAAPVSKRVTPSTGKRRRSIDDCGLNRPSLPLLTGSVGVDGVEVIEKMLKEGGALGGR